MARAQAFFSASMYACGPSGTHSPYEIRKTKWVRAYDDRLQIDAQAIPFERVLEIETAKNLIGIRFLDEDGHPSEHHLRYEKFLPGQGAKAVRRLARQLEERRSLVRPPEPLDLSERAVEEVDGPLPGRLWVKLRRSRIAFPCICPHCLSTASRVGYLEASSISGTAAWLVPICAEHEDPAYSIEVHEWSRHSHETTFSFSSTEYGQEFLRLNRGEERALLENENRAMRFEAEVRTGAKVVVFQSVISAVVVTVTRFTRPHLIGPGQSALVKGLPSTLITLLAGWWALSGPIPTIVALSVNLKGGVDLTQAALDAMRGRARVADVS